MKLVSVIEYRRCRRRLYKTRDTLGLSKRRVEEERPYSIRKLRSWTGGCLLTLELG